MLEQLLETSEIPVPDALVEAEVTATSRARTGSRTTSTAPRSTRAPARRLQAQFLLDAIVEKEEV